MDAFLSSLSLLSDINVILFLILGCFVGVVFGLIPGLGSVQALVLVAPFTFWLPPEISMYVYAGIMGSTGGAGAVTAILINTPGTAPNITSTFDGYPMTLRGEAARAISMSTIGAVAGEFLALAVVVVVLPLVKTFILAFGSPEVFWIIMLGVVAISAVSGRDVLKGLVAGGIGFLLSFVGYSSIADVPRYTLGSEVLWQGITLVPFFMGIFAVPQVLAYLSGHGTIAGQAEPEVARSRVLPQMLEGARDVARHWFTVVRSAFLGFVVGIIPGIGGVTATFLAYTAEVQASRDKDRFGKGAPEGLIASDSAIHASSVGALLPTVALGIPGSIEMAVFLGILIMHGVQPGPRVLTEHEGVVWTILIGLALAQIVSSVMLFSAIWWFKKLTEMPTRYLGVPLAVVIFIGCYAIHNSIWDVGIALIAGLGACLLTRHGYPMAPLGIGFILGPMLERSFLQTLMSSYGSYSGFFQSWLSVGLCAVLVATVAGLAISARRRGRNRRATNAGA